MAFKEILYRGIPVIVDEKVEENCIKFDKDLRAYKCRKNILDKIKKMFPAPEEK